MRRRRPVVQYASMTSLADVMFILVFAALIYSAGLEQKAKKAAEAPAAPPEALAVAVPELFDPHAPAVRDVEELRRAALARFAIDLEGRTPVVVRVGRDGRLRALERGRGGQVTSTEVDVPLVERVPDPDIALVYLGDRQDGLRLCSLVRLHLGAPADLADTLVIVALDAPIGEISVALARGLQRDVERCLADQRGSAVIVEPRSAGAAPGPAKEGDIP